MARREFGSIARVSKDVYRLRWMEDTPDGRKRRSETVRGTKREAALRLSQISTEIGRSYGGAPTVGRCWERWWVPDAIARLEEGSLAKSSYDNFMSNWKNHVCPTWGDVPIDKIKREKVAEWLQGMSAGTARVARSMAKQVLEFAVMYDVIDKNPFDFKVRMPTKKAEQSKDVYDLDTLLRVAREFRGTPIEAAVILAGLGSCRVGESLAARKEELFEVEAWGVRFVAVPICRQVSSNTRTVTDRLKNEWSYRCVLLPEAVGDRLLTLATGEPGWLCDNGVGKPINPYSAKRVWYDVIGKNGLPSIPFRNLRNSWETAMNHEVGVHRDTIERLMGHACPGTSGKHYDRPVAEQLALSYARAYVSNPFARTWD